MVVYVLDGDIQIFYNFGVICDLVDKLLIELVDIEVVEPYPLDAVYLGQAAAELGQTAPAVQVGAVAGDVLRDDDKLLDAVRSEIARLLDDVLHIAGAVAAADKGDGTEGAEVVAALGDAQICPARTGGDNAGDLVNGGAVVAEGACTSPRHYGVCRTDDIAEAADAEHGVNFRHLGHDAVLISLGKTAGDDKPAELAGLLELRHFKDIVDSLALRSVNKAAGVHDGKVCSLRIGDERIARLAHKVEHLFAVDKILGTAERDHRKGFFHDFNPL